MRNNKYARIHLESSETVLCAFVSCTPLGLGSPTLTSIASTFPLIPRLKSDLRELRRAPLFAPLRLRRAATVIRYSVLQIQHLKYLHTLYVCRTRDDILRPVDTVSSSLSFSLVGRLKPILLVSVCWRFPVRITIALVAGYLESAL